MPKTQPLNLAEIDPPVWRVIVGDAVYGPYTLGQMRGFVAEGRVAHDTKIAEGNGGAFLAAAKVPALADAFADLVQDTADADTAAANYVIVATLVAEGQDAIRSLLNTCGLFAEAAPGIYILRSNMKLAKLRAALNNAADTHDKIMIVNASSGRLAWLGLGPETDIHIKSVWDADLDDQYAP